MDGHASGIMTLEIHGEKVYMSNPTLTFDNLLASNRLFRVSKNIVIVDPTSNLRAVITFGKNDKLHMVDGIITQCPATVDIDDLISRNKRKSVKNKQSLHKIINGDLKKACKEITAVKFESAKENGKLKGLDLMGRFSGSWAYEFFIDGDSYWDRTVPRYRLHYERDPLPSDSRFRNDVLWFKSKNLEIAQRWKHRYEEIYRIERKKRKKMKKKRVQEKSY